jgi:hypothetical protein
MTGLGQLYELPLPLNGVRIYEVGTLLTAFKVQASASSSLTLKYLRVVLTQAHLDSVLINVLNAHNVTERDSFALTIKAVDCTALGTSYREIRAYVADSRLDASPVEKFITHKFYDCLAKFFSNIPANEMPCMDS